MDDCWNYLEKLAAAGGPSPAEYEALDAILNLSPLKSGLQSGAALRPSSNDLRDLLPPASLLRSILEKPLGLQPAYAIMERICNQDLSGNPGLTRWDHYVQSRTAAQAFRHRNRYFCDLVLHSELLNPVPRALLLACGSGRELHEYSREEPGSPTVFDVVEPDSDALAFAQQRLNSCPLRIAYCHSRPEAFSPAASYDLIWSAGLLDQIDDQTALPILRRYLRALAPGGELVMGNLSPENPNRSCMEKLDWSLYHRSLSELTDLGEAAGEEGFTVSIASQREYINLFLHIRRADDDA